jgi:hypothetical protein
MLVYDPVAPCLTEPEQARSALDSIAGKTIGFIDNSKPNFNHLADELAELLIAKHGVKEVITRCKRSASEGVPDAVMAELVERCDAIITGSGD